MTGAQGSENQAGQENQTCFSHVDLRVEGCQVHFVFAAALPLSRSFFMKNGDFNERVVDSSQYGSRTQTSIGSPFLFDLPAPDAPRRVLSGPVTLPARP